MIGDRRTAALVAADGTIDWLCLPHYGGDVVLGAILDIDRGGFWRLGPAVQLTGKQLYRDDTATLSRNWDTADFALELADTMAPPYESGLNRARSDGFSFGIALRPRSGGVLFESSTVQQFRAGSSRIVGSPIKPLREPPTGTCGLWTSRPLANAETPSAP